MKRILTIFVCCFLYIGLYAQTPAERIQQFKVETGAAVTLHKATETPNFVRLPQGRALRFSGSLTERTNTFLAEHGAIFGIENPNEELSLKDITRDQIGFRRYTLEQYYQGVPIFDGQLHFHFDTNEDISAVNGNFLPNISINTTPAISSVAAALLAVEAVTEQNRGILNAPLFVQKNTLYVFNPGMPRGLPTRTHLVYEVEVRNDLDVREYVFIDAHKGHIVEQYTGIACALFRRLYENNTGSQIWQEGDAFPAALDQWQQNEVAVSAHSYHLYNNAFGYDSYDGAGAEMRTVNNDPGIACPNANWNGSTANYCTGTAADDVVAHEWGHAYTEYTNGLIYSYESGAMNEAFSDIWGETVDLLNAYEDAGEDNSIRSGTGCSESNRWKMGEDATAFGGAIRDMWVPGCNGHPSIVGGANYHCAASDNGGVHINSGIPNRAYALLVDGGTFNGQTVTSIGFVKAAHIFWRAQSVYLTKTSDFAVLADALEQACQDLMTAGTNLEGLSTTTTPAGLSGQVISAADCTEVMEAVLAVDLRADNGCGFTPLLVAAPAVCGSGTPADILFSEDWEAGMGAWTVTQIPTNAGTWDARDWALETSLPSGRAGTGVFGTDPTVGDCVGDLDNGIIRLQSPVIPISGSATGPILMTFEHYISMENRWDGGQVHYSLNSGAWTRLPGTSFTTNGYNNTLQAAAAGNDNPYAGQEAFTGADGGSVSGTWGQSQVDLSTIGVTPGDNLELRWEVATDGCNGWDGWYLDEIVIYSCTPPAGPNVAFSAPNSINTEDQANIANGCLDYYEARITLEIGAVPSQPVDVLVNSSGSATLGATADYTFSPNMFTLDGTNLSQDITVRIYDDAIIEGPETIVFDYIFNPNGGDGGAGSVNQTHTITINDDDIAPGNISGLVILSDNFDGGIAGWTVINGGNGADTWQGVPNYGGVNTLDGTPFLFVDSDAPGPGNIMYEIIESPVMNTQGMTNMMIDFEQYFRIWGAPYSETCSIDVWDGAAWQNVFTQTEAAGTLGAWSAPVPVNVAIPDAYANPNMQIRFIYDAQYDYWWAIDNLVITGDQSTIVQSPVNTGSGDEQYLGPNAEIYFYDPATGNIMARIQNLTAHDYGCTTVEVERAGTTANNGWTASGINYVVDKTFQITPTNPNPVGDFELSLYYTEAEIAGWETASGLPRADLMHTHTTNNMPTPMTADMRDYMTPSIAAYGSDWTYTATYSGSDFVDFGLAKEEAAILISPKVFLQGPLSGTLMNDDLRAASLVPLTDPYAGTESTTTAVLAVTGTQAVIDWVNVEIRDAAGTTVLAARAALLLADGTVVSTDGTSAVRFTSVPTSLASGQNYHIAIHHRNHLAVMTATAIPLN